ncbi:MAG TPA: hypothetical protein VEA59_03025 [Patescibacteria group bacterium]|nr:hypothetical protein [Patescibacteria group bacterium]
MRTLPQKTEVPFFIDYVTEVVLPSSFQQGEKAFHLTSDKTYEDIVVIPAGIFAYQKAQLCKVEPCCFLARPAARVFAP